MNSDIPSLPSEIIEASKSGRLVLFVGAGFSCAAGLTDWGTLKSELIEKFKVPLGEDGAAIKDGLRAESNFYRCFGEIQSKDRDTYNQVMKRCLIPNAETKARFKILFENLKALNPVSIVTLNVDCLLPENNPYGYHDIREKGKCWPWEIGSKKLFFFHGIIDYLGGDERGWVFNYEELKNRYKEADSSRFLHGLFSGFYQILFVGFSFSDELLLQHAEIPDYTRKEIKSGERPPFHFALVASNANAAINRMEAIGVRPLIYKIHETGDPAKKHENFARTLTHWSSAFKPANQETVMRASEIPAEGPEINA